MIISDLNPEAITHDTATAHHKAAMASFDEISELHQEMATAATWTEEYHAKRDRVAVLMTEAFHQGEMQRAVYAFLAGGSRLAYVDAAREWAAATGQNPEAI